MPIRYTTEETRSPEQVAADERTRDLAERTGGAWTQLTPEQRAQVLARLKDKKLRAEAARAEKQADQGDLEERVTRLEERLARLGG